MLARPFWISRIEDAWTRAPVVWLSGVRRSGKTTLARSLGDDRIHYLNCDLPATAELLRDPPQFFRACTKPVVVFDEIHQLGDPARILKIGADEFPSLRILATGSSTLAAARKFRDTLAGRKRNVHLLPVTWAELPAFGASIPLRLSAGGLPPALLSRDRDPSFHREWLDSFFARDIQRLFGFRDVDRFNRVFEYVLRQSGGLFDVSGAARALGVARATVGTHLAALEITHAATLVRPFHGGGQGEIVKMPRVYAFDTGFVAFARGWDPLRQDDMGPLWEHVVLEQIQAGLPDSVPRYWRTKDGREIDFVLSRRRDEADAIECKWNPDEFDAGALRAFRASYPRGRNFVVIPTGLPPRSRRYGDIEVTVCAPDAVVAPETRPSDWPHPGDGRTPGTVLDNSP